MSDETLGGGKVWLIVFGFVFTLLFVLVLLYVLTGTSAVANREVAIVTGFALPVLRQRKGLSLILVAFSVIVAFLVLLAVWHQFAPDVSRWFAGSIEEVSP